jgi:transposase InsO family protein
MMKRLLVHASRRLRQQASSGSWFYLSPVLGDFSRYILAWKVCAAMTAAHDFERSTHPNGDVRIFLQF